MKTFTGAWPALITPITQDGSVNVSAARDLIDYLLSKGADGFYLCGSTGQGVYMSTSQRELMLETAVDQVKGRVPIIAHVGSMVTEDAVHLARHAYDVAVDGVSSIIPPQFTTIETLFAYFAEIGEAVPELPVLPYILSTSINIVDFMQKLLEIPNVAGTKYTGPNMFEFNEIMQLGNAMRPGGWTTFSGMDEQCLYAAMSGSSGNIGSTLNFMPGIYKAIHRAHQTGNLATANDLQLRANEVTRTAIRFGFTGTMREMMAMLGIDVGPPLLPGLPLPQARRAELHEALAEVDFMEIAEI